MPLHYPGYRYCGPGTNIKKSDKEGGPVNELDEICRNHDLSLDENSKIPQKEADRIFIEKASKHSQLGNFFAGLVAANELLRDSTPGLRRYLPGTKKDPQSKPASGNPYNLHIPYGTRTFYPDSTRHVRPTNSAPKETPKQNKSPTKQETKKEGQNKHGPIQQGKQTPQKSIDDSGIFSQPSAKKRKASPLQSKIIKKVLRVNDNGELEEPNEAMEVDNDQQPLTSNPSGESAGSTTEPEVTKTTTMKFTRTFKHYIVMNSSFDNRKIQGWCDIPYQHICASLKPSDWQALNTTSRRWSPISCGFQIHHIVPIEIETEDIYCVYNSIPYLEVYNDVEFICPINEIYIKRLPNNNMTETSTNPRDSVLKSLQWSSRQTQPKLNLPGQATFSKKYTNMDFMNSPHFKAISQSETHEYKWIAKETKWRHAMLPAHNTNAPSAAYNGRWDGGIPHKTTGNQSYTNKKSDNYKNPAPSCLIRTMQLHGNDNKVKEVLFMVLITYTSEVLIEINDVRFFPLFTHTTDGFEIDIYNSKPCRQQWPGTNHHNLLTGPVKSGYVL